jgi:hypothetical protein
MAAIDQYLQQSNQNRDEARVRGNELYDYNRARSNNYYDPLEEEYRQRADSAYGTLLDTPGYDAGESAGIMGDPRAAFQYYNPDQLSADVDRGNAAVSGAASDYGSGLRTAADRTGTSLRGAADNLGSGLRTAASDYGAGVRDAASRARTGLNAATDDQTNWQNDVYGYLRGENEGALGEYGDALGNATDRDRLALSSDFSDRYQMSPQEAQGIKDVAAQTTSGQYAKMVQSAKMRAAAQGNTSPAALAAIEEELGRTGAAEAGDAASRAALQANAEAASRRRDIESMRLGTEQDLANRGTSNAGNLYSARQGSARDLAGLEQQGIQSVAGNRINSAGKLADLDYNAADTAGRYGYSAAETGGKYGYDAENTAADQGYRAADSGGQANTDAAKYGANSRIAINSANQATGQGLATQADTARSARTGQVANQRITGQNTYRGYVSDQQGRQQQGSQNAGSQTINAYGTQGGLQNQATGQGMQGAQAKDNKPGILDKVLGAAGGVMTGVGALKTAFEHGGIADKPTLAMIGERGPEKVIKLKKFGRYGMSNCAA